jgi:hypothetical protein
LRFIRPIRQLLLHSLNGEVAQKLKKFDKNPVKGGLKYLLAGVRANRAEWNTYKKYGSDILAPTLWSFYGFINIQARGGLVTENEISEHVLVELMQKFPIEDDDTINPIQFCKINGSVVLVDYGREELHPALSYYKELRSSA